jgi:hypothetical protein
MGKKGRGAGQGPSRGGGKKLVALLLALVVAALAGYYFLGPEGPGEPGGEGQLEQSLRRGETRPTLEPGLFRNPTIRKAYQVAKDIPWVLDSIYCFCFCEESPAFRHKSLLSCYVDGHAAG